MSRLIYGLSPYIRFVPLLFFFDQGHPMCSNDPLFWILHPPMICKAKKISSQKVQLTICDLFQRLPGANARHTCFTNFLTMRLKVNTTTETLRIIILQKVRQENLCHALQNNWKTKFSFWEKNSSPFVVVFKETRLFPLIATMHKNNAKLFFSKHYHSKMSIRFAKKKERKWKTEIQQFASFYNA